MKSEMEIEQGRGKILRGENQRLRRLTVELQQAAEQEEEYISNTLLKRIQGLKKEKGEILQQVEREEEFMTNMLQRRLEKLQQEKIDIENALEQEQEMIVNRLQKQMEVVMGWNNGVGVGVGVGAGVGAGGSESGGSPVVGRSEPHSPVLQSPVGSLKWRPGHAASSSDFSKETVVEILKSEVNAARIRIADLEREVLTRYNQMMGYKKEIVELRKRCGIPVNELMQDEPYPSVLKYSPAPRTRSFSASGGAGAGPIGGGSSVGSSSSLGSSFSRSDPSIVMRARSASSSVAIPPASRTNLSGSASESQAQFLGQISTSAVPPRQRRISGSNMMRM